MPRAEHTGRPSDLRSCVHPVLSPATPKIRESPRKSHCARSLLSSVRPVSNAWSIEVLAGPCRSMHASNGRLPSSRGHRVASRGTLVGSVEVEPVLALQACGQPRPNDRNAARRVCPAAVVRRPTGRHAEDFRTACRTRRPLRSEPHRGLQRRGRTRWGSKFCFSNTMHSSFAGLYSDRPSRAPAVRLAEWCGASVPPQRRAARGRPARRPRCL